MTKILQRMMMKMGLMMVVQLQGGFCCALLLMAVTRIIMCAVCQHATAERLLVISAEQRRMRSVLCHQRMTVSQQTQVALAHTQLG
jgi:hypothetical protein